jgi:hypothetical protein
MTKRNITNRGNTHQKAIVKATSKATSIFPLFLGSLKPLPELESSASLRRSAFEAQKREGNEVFFLCLAACSCLPAFDVGGSEM